jgi:hypothetical protein
MRSGTALLVGVLGCTMDRQMVLDHLALAERHIAEGKIAIERQQTLIAELEQGGHDITMSRQLLSQFFTAKRCTRSTETDCAAISPSWMLKSQEARPKFTPQGQPVMGGSDDTPK